MRLQEGHCRPCFCYCNFNELMITFPAGLTNKIIYIVTGGQYIMGAAIKELLEAGVHFGHQTKRWNPKMKKYIFGERNGIYIIDLQKTMANFDSACEYLKEVASQGKDVLFVGTKKQAQDAITEEAKRCGMYYVSSRWLGGMLTNFSTIKKSIDRLKKIEKMKEGGT